jgi:hypothetical protein
MVVAAYGLILPQAVLDMPRFGCINIHASLLPRWRGAAPIQRAILAGDAETGVCIMQMEAGLDTGPVLLSGEPADCRRRHGGDRLHDKLADSVPKLDRRGTGQAAARAAARNPMLGSPTRPRSRRRKHARLAFAGDSAGAPGARLQSVSRGLGDLSTATLLKVWRPPWRRERRAGNDSGGRPERHRRRCGEARSALGLELQKAGGKRLPAHSSWPECRSRRARCFRPSCLIFKRVPNLAVAADDLLRVDHGYSALVLAEVHGNARQLVEDFDPDGGHRGAFRRDRGVHRRRQRAWSWRCSLAAR